VISALTEKWVNAGGFHTRYLEAGDREADPVLLLHDGAWGGASSVTWANIIPQLAARYRVLAPDLLGFGGTDKAVFVDRAQYVPRITQLREMVKHLGISKPLHLVGNSFGGSLALRILGNAEGFSLRSVVSICGTGGPRRTELSRVELGRWDGTEADLRRILGLLIDSTGFFESQLRERMQWAADAGHYRAVMAVSTPLPQGLAQVRPSDPWPEQLRGTTTPVLLVAGERDVLLESGWQEWLRGFVPEAQSIVLDCKHAPNIDRPELLLPALMDFLGRN
jgi:pimeloyl-ACP methyl ester carboxylesterase